MQLIETTVTETTVQMRFADNADIAAAKEWIEFCVAPEFQIENRTTDEPVEKLLVGEARLSALHAVQALIAKEIARTKSSLYPSGR